MYVCMYGWMDGRLVSWLVGLLHGWMHVTIDGWLYVFMDGWMAVCLVGCIVGWLHGWMHDRLDAGSVLSEPKQDAASSTNSLFLELLVSFACCTQVLLTHVQDDSEVCRVHGQGNSCRLPIAPIVSATLSSIGAKKKWLGGEKYKGI